MTEKSEKTPPRPEPPAEKSEEDKPKPQPSKTFAIPSRSALKEKINTPEKEEQSEGSTEPQSPVRTGKISEESLSDFWKTTLTKKEAEEKNTEARIFQSPYKLEDEQITIQITNEALLPTFEKIKFDLVNELKEKFKNDQINVVAQVVEMEKGQMRYTDTEKFEYLKEKYPALKDLQEKLGLDPEF